VTRLILQHSKANYYVTLIVQQLNDVVRRKICDALGIKLSSWGLNVFGIYGSKHPKIKKQNWKKYIHGTNMFAKCLEQVC
jgi:predicted sugar kinase